MPFVNGTLPGTGTFPKDFSKLATSLTFVKLYIWKVATCEIVTWEVVFGTVPNTILKILKLLRLLTFRNTDNAWMETVAVNFHDDTGEKVGRWQLKAGDDAKLVNYRVTSKVSILSWGTVVWVKLSIFSQI